METKKYEALTGVQCKGCFCLDKNTKLCTRLSNKDPSVITCWMDSEEGNY
jgi:hypothetical protein